MKMQWLALVLVVTSMNAEAQTNASILEISIDSCGNWVKERASNSYLRAQLESWSLGFLSGWSWTRTLPGAPLKGVDEKAVFGWLDNYCRVNSRDGLPTALTKLVIELENRAFLNFN